MGTSSSCCCQKVGLVTADAEASNLTGQDGSVREAGVNQEDDVLEDNSVSKERKHERKAKDKVIGNKQRSANLDDATDSLLQHKRGREKGLETRKLIISAMKQDRVCALLEEPEIETILETMEYYEFDSNEFIVRQGQAGTTFFVAHDGTLEVSVNGSVCNTMRKGNAFGGLALLYNCPRTASVKALDKVGVWGANGSTFHRVMQENTQKHYAENRKFIDSIRLFDGLTDKQKDRVGESFFVEVVEAKMRVYSQGEEASAIYFVKKGELRQFVGGTVSAQGELVGGTEQSQLGSGECFGERALLDGKPHSSTVVTSMKCELLCISVGALKEVLGEDWGPVLERNFILQGLKKSPVISQFSSTQQYAIVQAMTTKQFKAGETIEEGLRFAVVIDGDISGNAKGQSVKLARGEWYEEGANVAETEGMVDQKQAGKADLRDIRAGSSGARLGVLTKDGLANALKELGLSAIGSAEQAIDYTRKMVLAKKVHIFRHLSQEQTNRLVRSFVLQTYKKGDKVITQGEVGTSFFVIAQGEVKVFRGDKHFRNLGKNSYFGERALLFDEPRTATVEVISSEAELWSIEKTTFSQIVKGNMQQELMHRIRLQDTNLTMKDLKAIKLIGAGAAGVVRLVEHKKTKMRYALKRVLKSNGKIPEEVKRECDLLAENDHPFIMAMVKTFETAKSVYILTELITGGELHGAIRQIPTVLSRSQAQFYTGSLVIVLEELSDRNIVYRDLKPENVMLDQQGYLKLIDFGIAKKLEEGKSRTFTMIGTPHYMAPEVMRGHGYGTEVDLWSLGVMFFEFVCGYLPFADELDDPTEVCTAVLKHNLTFPSRYRDQQGRAMMQGLLCRQPKKRLGAGIHGYEDVKSSEYFKVGHQGQSLFNKIMGRELDPPVIPKGETYSNPEELQMVLSDDDELG
eukprot:TRINITY_DN10025_c0_g1_i1.p1 TRINITY_DN10025_c0_g1~~TRINITY_DN10025_c0_g1_i1.p1  ORF type:complete len:916 (+),score=253.81 TRINITY_DN10025_c0_g1_i1:120-2867(+)